MSTSAREQTETIYQLKITMRGISPLIWRRVLVRSDTTIARLHAIMQMTMGWEGLHLHRFRIQGRAYGVARLGGLSFPDDPAQVRLSRFRLRSGERFLYRYDLDDLWQPDIRLEYVRPAASQRWYPVCVAGADACPPEDCGGTAGYARQCRMTRTTARWWRTSYATSGPIIMISRRITSTQHPRSGCAWTPPLTRSSRAGRATGTSMSASRRR